MRVVFEALGMIDVLQVLDVVSLSRTFPLMISNNTFRMQIQKSQNFYMIQEDSSLGTSLCLVLLYSNFIIIQDWHSHRNKVLCERFTVLKSQTGYVYYHKWKPHGVPTYRHSRATQIWLSL
jgi:hypothetical protein